jgi:hypothetical protein
MEAGAGIFTGCDEVLHNFPDCDLPVLKEQFSRQVLK